MAPSLPLLLQSQGYQVQQTEHGFAFARPPQAGSPLAAWLGFGLGFLLSLVAVALFGQSLENATDRADLRTTAVLLVGLAIAAFLFGRRAHRTYQLEKQQAGQRLSLSEQGLRTERGDTLAPLSQLRLDVRIDWSDGMGGFRFCRILSLSWPGQRIAVFRSYDKKEVQALRDALTQLGLGSA